MEKRYIDQPRAAAAVRYLRAVSRGIRAPTRILCRISESVFCPALFLAFANSHSSFLFAPAFQSSCKIRCSLAGSLSEICRKLAKSCSCIRMCPNVLSQVSLLVIILSQVFWFYSPIYWTVRQSGAWLSPRPGPGETDRAARAALPGPRAGRGRAALPRRLRAPGFAGWGPPGDRAGRPRERRRGRRASPQRREGEAGRARPERRARPTTRAAATVDPGEAGPPGAGGHPSRSEGSGGAAKGPPDGRRGPATAKGHRPAARRGGREAGNVRRAPQAGGATCAAYRGRPQGGHGPGDGPPSAAQGAQERPKGQGRSRSRTAPLLLSGAPMGPSASPPSGTGSRCALALRRGLRGIPPWLAPPALACPTATSLPG